MILQLSRRAILGGILALPALVTAARAAQPIDAAADYGVVADSLDDMSANLQAALDAASSEGRDLHLPAGRMLAHDLAFPFRVRVVGKPGATVLRSQDNSPVGRADEGSDLVLEHIGFSGGGANNGLVELGACINVSLNVCRFLMAAGVGLKTANAAVTVSDCLFVGMGDAAIHASGSRGMFIRGNRIEKCGNAGVRIWRDTSGHDGSIVTGNSISQIDSTGGGNGQNGNGINIFRADGVIVSDNVISDCAFTAVRVNAGRNTQVRGNTCLNSGEVAIFSEFEFSGSIIADNLIDGAATGIDVTNLDSGGHLATISGNIVRNITPGSSVNPDTRPVGIYAEADTVVSGNTVDAVPGAGIVAGFGPFVRNVLVSNNVVINADIGIGVTVVQERSPGAVHVSGNLVAAKRGVVGMEWENIVSDDLARDAGRYPNVTVEGNTVSAL